MSLTSYRAAPSRGTSEPVLLGIVVSDALHCPALGRPGGDLLSHVLRRSTIGAESFHGRVRDGIGCLPLAMTTRSSQCRFMQFHIVRSYERRMHEITDVLRVPRHALDQASGAISTG